ncbi:MAG: response regulator [Verrucomicrobia bacterium]|nr:response regulator [Verrucomicrobiota bacterium]
MRWLADRCRKKPAREFQANKGWPNWHRVRDDLLAARLCLRIFSLKGSNGIELLKNIKAQYPKLPVLMLSMHDEEVYSLQRR